MPNLVKTVNYFDDGSSVEYNVAPPAPVPAVTEVDLTAGQTVTIKAI